MKKLYSLIRATMTSDMNIFKIKQKKDNKKSSILFPFALSLCFMFCIWSYANMMFEKLSPLGLQEIVLSLVVFVTFIFILIEGIYKTNCLLFDCKDDQSLLSLPLKRSTVLFIRIFKFYVFELMFNALFIIPLVIAYIRWADNIPYTFYITSIIMIFFLPIIPVVLSCIIGAIIASISSKFKFKNLVQLIVMLTFTLGIVLLSFRLDKLLEYITKNANSINDIIIRIYYPAGVYAKLCNNFNIKDLLIFIGINILLFTICIFILSKIYFKINSRLKKVTSTKKVNINELTIKTNSITKSLINKELNTFFKTPVFIFNAGFGLVLFLVAAIAVTIRYDSFINILSDPNTMNISKDILNSNTSIIIIILIIFSSFMTSITNSVISLEGRGINILKSLPINTKTILMSKIYSCLIITTPMFLLGDIILFIKFKTSIIDIILLLILFIILPLTSHFIGLIINLKYPKLDWESPADVVKQSTSSFIAVMLGMLLAVISFIIVTNVVGKVSSLIILLVATLAYIILDVVLYLYMSTKSVKDFNNLTI